jgi:hypothetical protein
MIVQAVNPSNVAKPLLVDASGNVLVSGEGLTSEGVPFKTDASGRLVVAGEDSGNVVRVVRVDGNGNIIVAPGLLTSTGAAIALDASNRIVIVAPSPSWLNPAGNLVSFANTALAAGTNTLTLYTVPASQRMHLRHLTHKYTGTVAGVVLTININRSGTIYTLDRQAAVANNELFKIFPEAILDAGDVVEAVVTGATVNDDFNADLIMYRIE